jgi:outer membrane protein assembly factor BamB
VGDHHILTGCGLLDQVGYQYSGICAYGKGNGHQVWQFSNPCNCLPEANVVAPLTYAHHVVFFGYFNGGAAGKEYVLAASSVNGQIYGAFQTGGINSLGSAAIVRGQPKIFFSCGNNVCGLTTGGLFAWQANIGAAIGGITSAANHIVYATLCNGSVGMVALDDATGAPLWSYGTPQCNQQPVAYAGNKVFLTAADGYVHALDAQTGSELWSAAAGAASSPSLANGVLYVAGGAGAPAASAYDAATGALLWSIPPHSNTHPLPPMVIDGTLYVANAECGSICAYALPTGHRH